MSNRYRDFDAFFAEQEREPVTFKLFGETHELPPALPATVVLKLIRMQKEYGQMGQVPHADLLEMAVSIFGDDRVNKWCEQGLDVEMLGELLKWVMETYMGGRKEEDEGNKKAPKKGRK